MYGNCSEYDSILTGIQNDVSRRRDGRNILIILDTYEALGICNEYNQNNEGAFLYYNMLRNYYNDHDQNEKAKYFEDRCNRVK